MIAQPQPHRSPIDPAAPLSVRDLTVTYDRKPVLWGLDYDAPAKGLIAVVGPNGAGKSTFLKATLGLVPLIGGTVRIFGKPVGEMRDRIAYVPQRESVDWEFPASALDVVAMGLYGKIGWLGRVTGKHKKTALEQLDRVGLADFADRQIGRLSGGQQQRVFLARALAQDAQVYLMDEPFAGVDAATERAILATLVDLQKAGRTVIVVHHDLDTVAEYFDHALVLNVRKIGDGSVADALSADILRQAYGGRLATAHLPDLARAG
mgnify:CR=1 FL=1|jgi:manganese/zinc/iron transport system ATP- binding protein